MKLMSRAQNLVWATWGVTTCVPREVELTSSTLRDLPLQESALLDSNFATHQLLSIIEYVQLRLKSALLTAFGSSIAFKMLQQTLSPLRLKKTFTYITPRPKMLCQ